jgi:septal ring factor EnvC (AmiA/AmiB activator)
MDNDYCVCKQRYMNEETKELIKEMKEYRNGMVARNLPFQWISDIITKWEMKKVRKLDFLEKAEEEKKELEESYQEAVRQAKERKTTSEQSQDELEPITSPMSDE